MAGCSRHALEALVLHSLEAGTPVTLERLEPLQEPEAEGADDAAEAHLAEMQWRCSGKCAKFGRELQGILLRCRGGAGDAFEMRGASEELQWGVAPCQRHRV